jgi:hypothetical protein
VTTESAPPPPAPAKRSTGKVVAIVIGVLVLGCCGLFAITSLFSGGGDKPAPVADAPAADATVGDTDAATEAPAVVEEPTDKPDDTAEPPTDVPATEPPPEPIHVEGSGQTATDAIDVPFPAAIASFTHSGSSNFVVHVLTDDNEDLLINEIGSYSGQVLLPSPGALTFDIDADGAWTLDINQAGAATEAAFSGKGDAVSGLFDAPDTGPWEFNHDGESNFAVHLICADGQDLIQNEIGQVSGSSIVRFGDSPCLWSVKADGNWSLAPR